MSKKSLNDQNYSWINFVLIKDICLKFSLNPYFSIPLSVLSENETALPQSWGVGGQNKELERKK